ncbi:hypothetical protein AMTR_s00002p00243230 [Amborella trichopoda]|uniref:Pentacotripeptide-repeat region of PRORP domain-containing protein n=2 Tax=Amborella trichopoda TaxID=13333 RepID=W1P0T9_AMBTC|nr:hypothetical protein AMTR_s00002p00243230 [Amborella trichopoda]
MSLIASARTLPHLMAAHALLITSDLHQNNYALSKLLAPLSSLHLNYATSLFLRIQNPNAFLSNTIIRARANGPDPRSALSLFAHSPHHDAHAFAFALIACANSTSLWEGRQLHSQVTRNGMACGDCFLRSNLVRLYVQCGRLADARLVFDETPGCVRDNVIWHAIIHGYVREGRCTDAFALFNDMQIEGVGVDRFVATTMLTACAHVGALRQGRWVHELLSSGVEVDDYVGTALVDMYAKCGCIERAVKVFDEMPEKNVHSWTAMIVGLAMHGMAAHALRCFDKMQALRIRPDPVTLLGVLTACSHGGMVEEGLSLFSSMVNKYNIEPEHPHYGCIVDMLCRAGRLNEAFDFVKAMPIRPRASVWGALLSACKAKGEVGLAERAVEELAGFEQCMDGAYTELANLYACVGRRGDAKGVREVMGSERVRKTPGCSVIEVGGEVSEFVAGDEVHPLMAQIREVLAVLNWHMIKVDEKILKV